MSDSKEYTPEQIAAIMAENERLKQENAQHEEVTAELNEQLDAVTKSKGKALPTVTSEKKQYQVLAPKFLHPKEDREVTAEELVKDKELVKQLIKSGSGILKEIV